uniref:SGNH hydrolase-type esterase domain-containing protein n=1 Tax=Chrysemys picta bellii TaxID=8478 RepID=A0A8C3IA66_CHRPI
MQAEVQQRSGGYPVYCAQCSMYNYLPCKRGAYVCIRCKELLAPRDHVRALETRVAELEELREAEKYVDEAFWDTVDLSHLWSDSPCAVKEDERLREGEQSMGAEGNLPVVGTLLSHNVGVSSRTEVTSLGEETPVIRKRQVLVMGDSIIRNIDNDWENRMVTCLPGATVVDRSRYLHRLMCSAGEEPVVVVHVGTNDIGKGRRDVLEAKFRLLGKRLKSRTSMVAFSEMLPVPRAGLGRQAELQSLNAWMRRWCREEGFRIIRNWGNFWDTGSLYRKAGLHLNQSGSRLLALNIKKVAEQFLN